MAAGELGSFEGSQLIDELRYLPGVKDVFLRNEELFVPFMSA
jgi:hypothetical protein